MKMTATELGLITLLGTGVVVLTPFIAGFLSGIGFLGTQIIPGILTLGTMLAAGVSAWVMQFVIANWLSKK